MAGIEICEPTELYNVLVRMQSPERPSVVDDNYLLLLDARPREDYNECHIETARFTISEGDIEYGIPSFGPELSTVRHVIVYDSNTVSIVEHTPAVKCARMVSNKGTRDTVKVLKGGFERFSAEYPFLQTQKIIYTKLELEKFPRYPSEILPLSLYLGDRTHAYNAALNYDMKISAHLNMAAELYPAYPLSITTLHLQTCDSEEEDLVPKLEEVCEFLDRHVNQSERVLVYGELGISRSATVCIAYLMKRKQWTLKVAYDHVKRCRPQVRPLRNFVIQLSQWEQRICGSSVTDIEEPKY